MRGSARFSPGAVMTLWITAIASLMLAGFSSTPAAASWTVLVYMAGDNNLEGGQVGVENIRAMEKVPAHNDLNILVQFDRPGENEFGSFGGGRRYLIKPREDGAGKEEIASLLLNELGTVNMGDPATLVDFVRFGIEQYPADHYFLILWNHGTGWETLPYKEAQDAINFLDATTTPVDAMAASAALSAGGTYQSIAYDDGAKDSITAVELWEAFEQIRSINDGRKIDVVGFDACLMGMAEVGTQIAHGAGIMVASEEIAPESGWNYEHFLRYLAAHPDASPRSAARAVVDGYVSLYRVLSQEVVLAVIDLDNISMVLDGMREFADALLAEPRHVLAVRKARERAKKFDNQSYLDMVDLAEQVGRLLPDTPIQKAANKVCRIGRNQRLVRHVDRAGISLLKAHGLAIYFPMRETSLEKYSELDFAHLTGWDKYLAAHFSPGVVVLNVVDSALDDSSGDGVVSPGEGFTARFRLEREHDGHLDDRLVQVEYSLVSDAEGLVSGFEPVQLTLPKNQDILEIEFSGEIAASCPVGSSITLNLSVFGDAVATVDHSLPMTVSRPFIASSDVLLVVGGKESAAAKALTEDLSALGVTYDVWQLTVNGPIQTSILDQYLPGVVIRPVESATDEDTQLSSTERGMLIDYSGRGGSLLLYGQDIGYKLGDTKFFHDLCRTEFVRDNTGIFKVESVNGTSFIPSLSFAINGGDGSQKWPDELDPIAPAIPILKYVPDTADTEQNNRSRYGGRASGSGGLRGSGSAGIAIEERGHRIICLAFGLHGVEPLEARQHLLQALVRWLSSGRELEAYVSQPVSAGASPKVLKRSFKLRSKIEEKLVSDSAAAIEQGDLAPVQQLIEELSFLEPDERKRAATLARRLEELLLYSLTRAESGLVPVSAEEVNSCLEKLNANR